MYYLILQSRIMKQNEHPKKNWPGFYFFCSFYFVNYCNKNNNNDSKDTNNKTKLKKTMF